MRPSDEHPTVFILREPRSPGFDHMMMMKDHKALATCGEISSGFLSAFPLKTLSVLNFILKGQVNHFCCLFTFLGLQNCSHILWK